MLRRMRKRILLAALLLASLACVGFARQAREYFTTCGRVDLNKLGADGWELATATQDGNVVCLYFKRPK